MQNLSTEKCTEKIESEYNAPVATLIEADASIAAAYRIEQANSKHTMCAIFTCATMFAVV